MKTKHHMNRDEDIFLFNKTQKHKSKIAPKAIPLLVVTLLLIFLLISTTSIISPSVVYTKKSGGGDANSPSESQSTTLSAPSAPITCPDRSAPDTNGDCPPANENGS